LRPPSKMVIPALQVGVPVSFYAGTQFGGIYGLSFSSGDTLYDSTFAAPYIGGGPGTYGFSGGSTLPPGLTLNPSTGLISGTPTSAGIYYTFFTSIPSGVPTSGTWSGGTGNGATPPSQIYGSLSVGTGAGISWVGIPWTVSLQSQTITPLAGIPTKCYAVGFSGNTFSITAPTASSGLTPVLSILSGPATISGSTITVTGIGTVVVAANQAGNGTYSAAAQVTTSFNAVTASATLSNLSQPYTGAALSASVATTPPGLLVAVTYNGSATIPTAIGTYAVVATITDSSAPSGITASGTLTILDQLTGSPFVIPCGLLLVNLDTFTVNPSPAPLFFKKGDDIFIAVQFNNVLLGSTPTDHIAAAASGLQLQVRSTPNGEVILQSDSWIFGVDTASQPFYLVHMPASSEGLLDSILDNYAATGSIAPLFGQLLWNATNTTGVGPSLLAQASPVFNISIGNNLQ